MPTCPACYKESRKSEKINYLHHRVLRRIGIGYYRCAHCDAFYFGFPWYGWRWYIGLQTARRAAAVVLRCPKCGENRMHRSHRQGVREQLLRVLRIRPYRCEKCGHRFFALKQKGVR